MRMGARAAPCTCTSRCVHVPQWCCLATVWRSVFPLWAPDNDFGQDVLSTRGAHPFTLKRGKSPLHSSVWAADRESCLTQFHHRIIKGPGRGGGGYVCTFHSAYWTPPLAAFEQNCPTSLSWQTVFWCGVADATYITIINNRNWIVYEVGITIKDFFWVQTQYQRFDITGKTITVVQFSLVDEVVRSFTELEVPIQQYVNIQLQVEVLHLNPTTEVLWAYMPLLLTHYNKYHC